MADTGDLKSLAQFRACGFESRSWHQKYDIKQDMKIKILLLAAIAASLSVYAAPKNKGGNKGNAKPAKPVASKQVLLWKAGDAGINTYRIPALCMAPDGKTMVAACDAREDHAQDLNRKGGANGDYQRINIAIRTSKDGGKNWTPSVYSHEWKWDAEEKWAGSDPSFIVDTKGKKIFLFYNVAEYVNEPGIYKQYVQESADNGKTWSEPKDITADIRPAGWGKNAFVFITSGSGMQTKEGTLLHTQVWVNKQVALFGSEDGGQTWKAYGKPTIEPGDECKVVELSDGALMINSRKKAGAREIFVSRNKGESWDHWTDDKLADGACNAQIMSYPLGRNLAGRKVGSFTNPKEILIFSNCNAAGRSNLTLRTSWDDGTSWSEGLTIEPGRASYSDLCLIPGRSKDDPCDVGIIFEGSGEKDIRFCTIKSKDVLKK